MTLVSKGKAAGLFCLYVAGGAMTVGGMFYLIGWAIGYIVFGLRMDAGLEDAALLGGVSGALVGGVASMSRLRAALKKGTHDAG